MEASSAPLKTAGVFGGSLFSAMHGSLVSSSLIRETTENMPANLGYGSLATPNRDHSVHRGDTRSEGLVHGAPVHDAWGPRLKAAGLTGSISQATLIQRCTQRTHDPTAIRISNEDVSDVAWVVLTRLESLRCKFVPQKELAKTHRSDCLGFKIEGQTQRAIRELD